MYYIRKVHENELRELKSTIRRITPYRMFNIERLPWRITLLRVFMIAMYGISKVCNDELRY